MAIVVFIIFRTFVPSIAVVISAFADIAFAAAMMDVFGIVLSLGTVAALLMLIGYSVDTDILLTTRLLKRKGELGDKIKDAMKTGMTMTLTTLAALIALFVVSSGSYLVSSVYTYRYNKRHFRCPYFRFDRGHNKHLDDKCRYPEMVSGKRWKNRKAGRKT